MADGDNQQLVKLVALGGAGFLAYKFVYQPWQMRQRLQAEIDAQTKANLAKGMGIEEAGQKALSAACQAVAAFYKVPPDKSGGVCAGVGIVAEKALKYAGKGAIIAGKVIGKGIAKGARVVGHDVAVVGRGIGKGASAVGKVIKFTHYTAPKKVITSVAKAIKFTHYTAPKKVITSVGKGAKSVAKSISHGFGLWGLEEAMNEAHARRASVAALANVVRRQARGNLAPQRKRSSLAGLPTGGRRRSAGAAFYTKHLR